MLCCAVSRWTVLQATACPYIRHHPPAQQHVDVYRWLKLHAPICTTTSLILHRSQNNVEVHGRPGGTGTASLAPYAPAPCLQRPHPVCRSSHPSPQPSAVAAKAAQPFTAIDPEGPVTAPEPSALHQKVWRWRRQDSGAVTRPGLGPTAALVHFGCTLPHARLGCTLPHARLGSQQPGDADAPLVTFPPAHPFPPSPR